MGPRIIEAGRIMIKKGGMVRGSIAGADDHDMFGEYLLFYSLLLLFYLVKLVN